MSGKKFYMYLAFILLIRSVHCQNVESINKTLQDFSSLVEFRNSGADANQPQIEGTEFLDENFVNGAIITTKSEHYLNIPMRYNVFRDRMEVKLADGKIYDLTDHTKIFQILLKNRTLVYTEFDTGKKKSSGYLFMLYNGKSTLYSRNTKILVKAVKETNGITPTSPAKIVDKPDEFYIMLTDGLPRKFNSKKDFLNLLSKHASEMEDFVKKQKLKIDDADDLIKAVTYYDSL